MDFIIPVKSLALDKPRQGGLGDVGKFAAMHAAAKGSEQLKFRAVAVSEVRMERWGKYRWTWWISFTKMLELTLFI